MVRAILQRCLLLLIAGGLAQPAAAQGTITIPADLVVSTAPHPDPPPNDPDRCGGVVVAQFDDLLGREVATLADGLKPAGWHEAIFEASGLSSGVYLYRLEAAGRVLTGRMVLLK